MHEYRLLKLKNHASAESEVSNYRGLLSANIILKTNGLLILLYFSVGYSDILKV